MACHIVPDVSILLSIANANMTWLTALGEWIDNALDAQAKMISIEFGKEFIRVVDDGNGCSDPSLMVHLGKREDHGGRSGMGRYGVGSKDALLWTGGLNSSVEIRSIQNGLSREVALAWSQIGPEWGIEDPIESQAKDGDRGTSILVSGKTVRMPRNGQPWSDLLSTLGYIYSPALKKGYQIKLRKPSSSGWQPLVRWEMPTMPEADIVDTHISVFGKGARVRCGLVPEGVVNERRGITYMHKVRVIYEASSRGCGTYPINRICGFVELDNSWDLTKNKDGISRHAEELFTEVERVCRPVFEKAKTIGMQLASQAFDVAVTRGVNAALTAMTLAKAKRGRGSKSGTKRPTGAGGKHTQAEVEQIGSRFPSKSGLGSYQITYIDLPEERLGTVDGGNVMLNQRNPGVMALRSSENVNGTIVLALALMTADHLHAPAGQMRFREIPKGTSTEDFSVALGTILATGVFADGKPELKLAS